MSVIEEAQQQWEKHFENTKMAFPSEFLIRIFKGNYPRLNLSVNDYVGKKILDVGCGDGRNLLLAHTLGFNLLGTEISEKLVDKVKYNLSQAGIKNSDIRVGNNKSLPYSNEEVDYLVSWNSSYYMGDNTSDFSEHVVEFNRVLKKDGFLILSIPKSTSFIYKGSEEIRPGYRVIKKDPFNVRNGEVLKMFNSENDIENYLKKYFKNFVFASIEDDCFGYDYHWHIVVCNKR